MILSEISFPDSPLPPFPKSSHVHEPALIYAVFVIYHRLAIVVHLFFVQHLLQFQHLGSGQPRIQDNLIYLQMVFEHHNGILFLPLFPPFFPPLFLLLLTLQVPISMPYTPTSILYFPLPFQPHCLTFL